MGNTASSPPPAVTPPPAPVSLNEVPHLATPPPPIAPPSTIVGPPGMLPPPKVEQKVIPVEETLNPGTFEELHKKCKDLCPQIFEGGKVLINKGLSSHFQVSHTVNLSSIQGSSGYRFGATYVGNKQLGPQETYPVLLGDTDISGNLNANIIHAFTDNTRTKVVAQFQEAKCTTQLSTDFKGKTFSASITAANPNLLNFSGIYVGHYLQRITKHLDLGAEVVYQRGPHIPGNQATIMSVAGRLQGEKWAGAASVSPMSGVLHASYYQKINDALQVGTELETSLQMGESQATVVYQLELPNAGVTFKGQFDTNWILQATMEKKLADSQLPFTFILSAFANQVKSDYKFGIGMMLG